MSKICTVCGIEKELSEYTKEKTGSLGLCPRCKKCNSIKNKKYQDRNKSLVVSKEIIEKHLDFDCDSGVFFCKKTGFEAGTVTHDGYIRVSIKSKKFTAHRLAWVMYYGELPSKDIDHIDHDKRNNKKENLRLVSSKENARNKKLSLLSSTGVSGVSWLKRGSRWRVTIRGGSERIQVGEFNDFFEAVCARKSAEKQFNYHENHGKPFLKGANK